MRSPILAAILLASLVAGCTGFLVGRVSAVGSAATAKSVEVSGGLALAGAPSPGSAPLPAAVLQPSLEESVPAIEAGVASWYDDGPGLYAAVPGWHWGDTPYTIRVCRQDRPGVCTEATVRDFCGCPGNRIVDLSPTAFRRLAPLSAGLVRVTIESVRGVVVRGAPTLPATDWSP